MTIASYFDYMSHSEQLLAGNDHMQMDLGFSFRNRLDRETPLARMFAPLHVHIWMTIAGLMGAATIIILLMKNMSAAKRCFVIGGRVNRTPVYNMVCVALGGNIANQRMRSLRHFGTFARTLAMIWMLAFLILRNAYQCSLYDFLHTQKVTSPFDTFEGIKESDASLYIDNNSFVFLSQFFDKKRYDHC